MTTDEERFHNGDTLPDGIPIIRDDTPPPPPGGFRRPVMVPVSVPDNRPSKRRLDWLSMVALGAAVFAVVFVLLVVADRNEDGTAAARPTPSRSPAAEPVSKPSPSCIPATYKSPAGESDCLPLKDVCTPGGPWHVEDIDTVCGGPVEMKTVNVLSAPETGGDPSTSFCLAYTGSSSGDEQDAVLLMGAPGYQCTADLVNEATGQAIDLTGARSVFSDFPPQCTPSHPNTRMTYPVKLIVTGTTWDDGSGTALYSCANAHVGA